MNLPLPDLETFWLGAMLAVPVAVGVALICRLGVRSPATRHALWVVALLAFVAPGLVSLTAAPDWFAAARESLVGRPSEPEPIAVPSWAIDRSSPAETGAVERWPVTPIDSEPARVFQDAEPTPAISRRASRSAAVHLNQILAPATTDALLRAPEQAAAEPGRVRPDTQGEPPLVTLEVSPEPRRSFVSDDPISASERVELARAQLAVWGRWGAQLLADVRRIPPIPGIVWLLGAALALLVAALRIARDAGSCRASRAPTAHDQRLLDTAVERIALARPPKLCFVARRVSPMVTCGPRRRLIVPDDLWQTLDDDARLAVLLHELAHLRRRDHWTHWLSAMVGLVYWWHPLVWVVRSRLADEADMACDAWVTALMPTRRRAYATALLEATTFAHTSPRLAGASLAMASSNTRRLTRRLTMVMTHTVRPRPGAMGRSLVAAAAVLALLVLPGVACPPDKKEPPKAPPAPNAEPDSTFDQHMRSRADAGAPADREAHMAQLADRMAELEARLARLGDVAHAPHAPSSPTPPAPPAPPHPAHAVVVTPQLSIGGLGYSAESDEKVARAYFLPSGRLEDLTRLMSRSDVPTLINAGDDRIIVHAVPRDHAVFAGFATMICPEGVKVIDMETGREIKPHAAHSFGGVLPSVGVAAPAPQAQFGIVIQGDQGVYAAVHADECDASACEDECCEESCEDECDDEHVQAGVYVVPDAHAEHAMAEYRAHLEAMHVRLRELDSSKKRLNERVSQSQRVQSDLERHLAQYERQAERMIDRAEAAQERAEECAEEAAEMEVESRDLREAGRAERAERALVRAAELRVKADQMRAQSDQYRNQADVARVQAEESERAHELTEDQTDQLRDMLDALSDEIADIREALRELAEELAQSR